MGRANDPEDEAEEIVEAAAAAASEGAHSSAELPELITGRTADSPLGVTCGIKTHPAGSCCVCEG